MILELNGLAADCVIGDLPEERVRTQRLDVDVALEIPDDAAVSDALADTVDYAELTLRIRAALVAAKPRMIERAARIVAETCRENPKVLRAEVKVTKAGAVPHLASASARIVL